MADKLLVRGVSDELKGWVAEESHRQRMSQNEFLLALIARAGSGDGPTPTLFDGRAPVEKVVSGALPLTFVDIFAGIGGFRIGLSALGGRCLWTCEYDLNCQKTYKAWFGQEKIFGDINQLNTPRTIHAEIPDHDILAAGFPCQPFSIAGVSKKNSLGQAHGFDCERQGNLFFKLAEIVKVKKPPILMLENVKNLQSHDKGNTWRVIHSTLTDLGYQVFSKIVDASSWVPQHRERIIIVCFNRRRFGSDIPFEFPSLPDEASPTLKSILEAQAPAKYTLTDHLWGYLQRYAEKHRAKGNGFGFGLFGPDDRARTLSARYYKDGSEILIRQNGKNPRRLTIREAARIMGFTEARARACGHDSGFPQVVSDTQAYKQFGNSVVPAVIEAVGRSVFKAVNWSIENCGNRCLLKQGRKVSAARRVD